MVKLIAEGGVAGHLAHLYDNRSLTFEKLAEILTAASKGKLVGTEKTDGFNVYLGFKNGEAKAARNKGDMQKGGMNAVDLAMREFKGGPSIKKVYVDSFNAFEAAVASLTDEEKLAIFGPEGEIFYNSEIMGPGASNVVNYDSNIITIHGSGHKRYDADTDKVVVADVAEASKALDSVVDRFEQATQGKNFGVQRTALVNLQKLSGDHDLKIALEKIKKAGFQGDMTVEDYLDEKLSQDVEEKFRSLDEDLRQQMVDRILKKEGAPTLTQIYRGLGGAAEMKDQVRSYVQTGNKTISKLIWPIEDAIHDFAVAMLENMESAYILDNNKEISRLKGEVETAIKSIQAYQGPGQEMAHEILAKQLKKIKNLDNITSVAEGFVFEYDGQLYKFTGNFAPINQILGLFRYGRGGVKIPRVDEAKGATETVAIVPGAFKPPHRGHLDMVKHYADNADRVIVMVSPKARQTPSGQDVGQEQSIAIWELYLNKAGLTNVEVIPSPHPSPVRSAYEYVENTAQPGENVILGTSTKGGDQSRFAKNVQAYAKEGVRVLDPMKFAFDPVGEELSASDFRSAAESSDINRFLPSGVEPQDVLDILGIQGGTEEVVEHAALPLFFRLIEEALDEMEPIQKFYAKDHAKKRMSTKGEKKKGGAPYDVNPPKARAKSAPPGFGGALEEEHRLSEGIQDETWYYSTDEPIGDSLEPMYLVPNRDNAEMTGKHVYAFKFKPGTKWFDLGADEEMKNMLPYNIDTLGYLSFRWEDFTYKNIDVVWDIPDFKQGFEKIFVVNPESLEQVDMELGELSSMAGGSVEGYSLPLGAKPKRKKKKKKVYMEPHMHQDGGNLQEISTSSGGSIEQLYYDIGVTDKEEQTLRVKKKTEKNSYPYGGIKINIKKKNYRHDNIKFPRLRKDAHKYNEE
jgi:cytidyltransferase-like protein